MTSIARTFGEPLTVPAGKVARITSRRSVGAQAAFDVADDVHDVPVTLDHQKSFTFTEANSLARPTSLRARSTSMQVLGTLLGVGEEFGGVGVVLGGCCAAFARAGDRAHVILHVVVASCRTRISGDAPTMWKSPRL